MTPEQQAASDALGRAVLATERAKRAMDALSTRREAVTPQEWYDVFDAWRDLCRAEPQARAGLAELVSQEVGKLSIVTGSSTTQTATPSPYWIDDHADGYTIPVDGCPVAATLTGVKR